MIRKKKAMTSEKASYVNRQGHKDAKEFAKLIGLADDYQNDQQAKKDVIDSNGDAHSVKSGQNKWQIFLYGAKRFETDNAFKAMNGIGQLLSSCINAIPDNRDEYITNKPMYKSRLQPHMIDICTKLQEKYRLQAFLEKAMFNGAEVQYLTIKNGDIFNIFWGRQVVEILSQHIVVENSKARQVNQTPNLKVVFKIGTTCGEIEMRNGETSHHKEIKFWLKKRLITDLLIATIQNIHTYNNKVIIYGDAIRKFCKK